MIRKAIFSPKFHCSKTFSFLFLLFFSWVFSFTRLVPKSSWPFLWNYIWYFCPELLFSTSAALDLTCSSQTSIIGRKVQRDSRDSLLDNATNYLPTRWVRYPKEIRNKWERSNEIALLWHSWSRSAILLLIKNLTSNCIVRTLFCCTIISDTTSNWRASIKCLF